MYITPGLNGCPPIDLCSSCQAARSPDCWQPPRYMLQRKGRLASPLPKAKMMVEGGFSASVEPMRGRRRSSPQKDPTRHLLCTPASPPRWPSWDPSGSGLSCSTSPRCWRRSGGAGHRLVALRAPGLDAGYLAGLDAE